MTTPKFIRADLMPRQVRAQSVCAWCGEFIRWTWVAETSVKRPVSHGICRRCMEKVLDRGEETE